VGSYYYLVSQLPYLMYGQTPPMSPEAFRELATPLLEKQDAALLDTIALDPLPLGSGEASYAEKVPSCGSEFIDNWREWERILRLNLAKLRFIKTKREGVFPVEPPGSPPAAVSAAAKALNEAPIEGETVIDKARWDAIDSLQGTDYFDRNTIFAYMLKLLILERQASFNVEKGFAEYKSLYASILEQSGTLSAGDYK